MRVIFLIFLTSLYVFISLTAVMNFLQVLEPSIFHAIALHTFFTISFFSFDTVLYRIFHFIFRKMMESPINPAIPTLLIKTAIGAVTLAGLFSVYHQRHTMLGSTDELFKEMKNASDDAEKVSAIEAIVARLRDDSMTKKGAGQLSAERHGKDLLAAATLKEDGSNSESVSAAAKLICRVFGQSNKGKKMIASLSGPQALIKSLSVAHSQCSQAPLEDIALTLRELTAFDEDKLVLQFDVPEGAECAYALARMNGIAKMLGILDPSSPKLLLSCLSSVLANICALDCGAKNIGKGCHGKSGISFFLLLLDHSDLQVVEASLKAVSYLCRAGCGHKEICEVQNVQRLSSNFSPNSNRSVIAAMLTIILLMTSDQENGPAFFTAVCNTAIIRTAFDIWVGGSDAETSARGEVLACLFLQNPVSNIPALQLLQAYRRPIEDRQQKDKMEAQKKQQQMEQQKFMQQMMMQQMGGEMMGM